MRPLSQKDRSQLAALRICTVLEPWLGELMPRIPHSGRRVLIPRRLAGHVETLPEFGGLVLKIHIKAYVIRLARAKLGVYSWPTTTPNHAPKSYSCSTFVAHMLAFVGIHMPRYAIDQSYVGERLDAPGSPGLAFYESTFPLRDRARAIGHVGITTPDGTLIHGTTATSTIVEQPIPENAVLFTDPFPQEPSQLLIIPNKIEGIETALDLARWLARPLH